jgi:hypothetical protein
VPLLEKTTGGPPAVGRRYREVVQVLPFARGEIRSAITRFEPDHILEEDFTGPSPLAGHLAYEFLPEQGGTRLIQREQLHVQGLLRLLAPLIKWTLGQQLRRRLEDIKRELANGNRGA